MRRLRLVLFIGLWATGIGACGTTVGTQRAGVVEDGGASGAALGEDASGAALALEDLRDAFAGADIVVVGERHADPVSVGAGLFVLEQVMASGRPVVIGVEWLPESANGAIAGFLSGALDEPAFLTACDWHHTWGFPFSAYAPIFQWARAHGVSIRGLNAPAGLARRLGRKGVDGLSEEDRRALTPLDSGTLEHKTYFAMKMAEVASAHGGHGGHHGGAQAWTVGSPLLERYYLSQLLRDENMARAAGDAWAPGAVVVIFAGLGHVEYGLGVPGRLGHLEARVLLVEPLLESVEPCGLGEFPQRRCDLRVRPPQ